MDNSKPFWFYFIFLLFICADIALAFVKASPYSLILIFYLQVVFLKSSAERWGIKEVSKHIKDINRIFRKKK